MNKVIVSFVMIVMILTAGVFADSRDVKEDIKDFVKKDKGVTIVDEDIKEVNFTDLPDAVDIEKIENTSIVIYEVNYSATKPLFVITSSGKMFESEPVAPTCDTRLLLQFGFGGTAKKSDFLNMANGVQGSLEKGYVMLRGGSITGISTNLEIIDSVKNEEVEIIIYKNGEEVGFRNILDASSSEVRVDYDVQSKGIVNFRAGDVISVYVNSGKGVAWNDVTTTIEITN